MKSVSVRAPATGEVSREESPERPALHGFVSRFSRGAVRWFQVAAANVSLIILLLGVFGFALFWSEIDLTRLELFHFSVYDLGVNYQSIWAAAHGFSPNISGPAYTHAILYLFVLPMVALGPGTSFLQFLLIFQNVWLALGALPLYFLCRKVLPGRLTGLVVGLTYLFFVPLNGPTVFPFHFVALFPTLFIIGYFLQRQGRPRASLLVFFLSSLCNIGTLVVLAFYGIGILGEPLLSRVLAHLKKGPRPQVSKVPTSRVLVGLALIVEPILLFTLYIGIGGYHNIESFAFHTVNTSSSGIAASIGLAGGLLHNLPVKLLTFALIFAPVLVIPIFGREERWALLPYFTLALVAPNFTGFLFPFNNQYASLFIGPLFCALVRGLERIQHTMKAPRDIEVSRTRLPRIRGRFRRHATFNAGTACLTLALLFSLFFAPWGPYNHSLRQDPILAPGYYDINSYYGGNTSVSSHLNDLINSIPITGWLLVQNNLPQAVARQYYTIPGFYNGSVPLRYVISDPFGASFYPGTNFGPYNTSMLYWANYYLADHWTVMGEADGALLLSSKPTPMSVYFPLDQYFGNSQFGCTLGGPTIRTLTNYSGNAACGPDLPVDGDYSVFSPGVFSLQVYLSVDHPAPNSSLKLTVTGSGGNLVLYHYSVNAAAWSGYSGPVELQWNLSFARYYPGMHITLSLSGWTGGFAFRGIQLAQDSPA